MKHARQLFFTVGECARETGIPIPTLRHHCDTGRIPCQREDNSRRLIPARVVAKLKKRGLKAFPRPGQVEDVESPKEQPARRSRAPDRGGLLAEPSEELRKQKEALQKARMELERTQVALQQQQIARQLETLERERRRLWLDKNRTLAWEALVAAAALINPDPLEFNPQQVEANFAADFNQRFREFDPDCDEELEEMARAQVVAVVLAPYRR